MQVEYLDVDSGYIVGKLWRTLATDQPGCLYEFVVHLEYLHGLCRVWRVMDLSHKDSLSAFKEEEITLEKKELASAGARRPKHRAQSIPHTVPFSRSASHRSILYFFALTVEAHIRMIIRQPPKLSSGPHR